MKSKVDKLDIDKLVPVSVDLSKLSYVVKNIKGTKTLWKYNRSNIIQTSFLCYVAGF